MPAFTFPAIEDGSCDCRPCSRRRGLRAAIGDGYVESYSSQPSGGWRRPAGDSGPTFGVELETSLAELPYGVRQATLRRFTAFQAVSRREAASLAAPSEHWVAKSDCSVSGPEFASQPASLDWWRSHRPIISQFLKELRHGGCGTEGAGLHVNIGTTESFSDAAHLARFATLCTSNPRFFTRMAGRVFQTRQHWAKFDAIDNPSDWGREVWNGGAFRTQPDRYSAVNGQPGGRVEFRLPAGTLDEVQFYAMLEWTASMVEFTRDASHPANLPAYIAWLVASGTYGEAESRMRRLFPARFSTLPAQRALSAPPRTTYVASAADTTWDAPAATCTARDGGRRCTLAEGHSTAHDNGSVAWYDDADHAEEDEVLYPQCPSVNEPYRCTLDEGHDGLHSNLGCGVEWPDVVRVTTGPASPDASSTLNCGWPVAIHRQPFGWSCPAGNTEPFDLNGCLARHDGTSSAWPCTCPPAASTTQDAPTVGELRDEFARYGSYTACLAEEPRDSVTARRGSYGWVCTRPEGHRGDHAAIDVPDMDRWPQR